MWRRNRILFLFLSLFTFLRSVLGIVAVFAVTVCGFTSVSYATVTGVNGDGQQDDSPAQVADSDSDSDSSSASGIAELDLDMPLLPLELEQPAKRKKKKKNQRGKNQRGKNKSKSKNQHNKTEHKRDDMSQNTGTVIDEDELSLDLLPLAAPDVVKKVTPVLPVSQIVPQLQPSKDTSKSSSTDSVIIASPDIAPTVFGKTKNKPQSKTDMGNYLKGNVMIKSAPQPILPRWSFWGGVGTSSAFAVAGGYFGWQTRIAQQSYNRYAQKGRQEVISGHDLLAIRGGRITNNASRANSMWISAALSSVVTGVLYALTNEFNNEFNETDNGGRR